MSTCKGAAHHQQLLGFSLSFTDRLGLSVPKAILAWGLVVLIGGAAGLLAMLICNYMLSFGGQDVHLFRAGGVDPQIHLIAQMHHHVRDDGYSTESGRSYC